MLQTLFFPCEVELPESFLLSEDVDAVYFAAAPGLPCELAFFRWEVLLKNYHPREACVTERS